MFPQGGGFSAVGHRAAYYQPDNLDGFPRQVDYERGGRTLHDSSGDLLYQNWRVAWDRTTKDVRLTSEQGFDRVMFRSIGLTQLSFSFDQSMTPYFAYTENGVTWLRWHRVTGEIVKRLVPGATQPRLTMDEKRPENVSEADTTLVYLKGTQLCLRRLRENFNTEHIMANDVIGTRLGRVGMTTGLRVQVELLP